MRKVLILGLFVVGCFYLDFDLFGSVPQPRQVASTPATSQAASVGAGSDKNSVSQSSASFYSDLGIVERKKKGVMGNLGINKVSAMERFGTDAITKLSVHMAQIQTAWRARRIRSPLDDQMCAKHGISAAFDLVVANLMHLMAIRKNRALQRAKVAEERETDPRMKLACRFIALAHHYGIAFKLIKLEEAMLQQLEKIGLFLNKNEIYLKNIRQGCDKMQAAALTQVVPRSIQEVEKEHCPNKALVIERFAASKAAKVIPSVVLGGFESMVVDIIGKTFDLFLDSSKSLLVHLEGNELGRPFIEGEGNDQFTLACGSVATQLHSIFANKIYGFFFTTEFFGSLDLIGTLIDEETYFAGLDAELQSFATGDRETYLQKLLDERSEYKHDALLALAQELRDRAIAFVRKHDDAIQKAMLAAPVLALIPGVGAVAGVVSGVSAAARSYQQKEVFKDMAAKGTKSLKEKERDDLINEVNKGSSKSDLPTAAQPTPIEGNAATADRKL